MQAILGDGGGFFYFKRQLIKTTEPAFFGKEEAKIYEINFSIVSVLGEAALEFSERLFYFH